MNFSKLNLRDILKEIEGDHDSPPIYAQDTAGGYLKIEFTRRCRGDHAKIPNMRLMFFTVTGNLDGEYIRNNRPFGVWLARIPMKKVDETYEQIATPPIRLNEPNNKSAADGRLAQFLNYTAAARDMV